MTEEEKYQKELKDAGVEIPEAEAKPEKEPEKEPEKPAKDAPAAEEPEKEPKKEEPDPLKDEPKEPQRKRSIYDDYKDKKLEAKTEKDLREKAERERDELKQKLEALGKAETPEEKKEAADDLEAFAAEIKADPAALRKMRDLFLKDFKLPTDEALKKDLDEFKAWKTQNASAIEKQAFADEFQKATPKLKELFPNASPEEMTAIREKLDAISHTKEWHDKSLPYVAFEHKNELSALISPKKRGMEGNQRKGDEGADSFEFDPNADYSTMTAKEREAWEAKYKELTKHDGLVTGANGKKIIL